MSIYLTEERNNTYLTFTGDTISFDLPSRDANPPKGNLVLEGGGYGFFVTRSYGNKNFFKLAINRRGEIEQDIEIALDIAKNGDSSQYLKGSEYIDPGGVYITKSYKADDLPYTCEAQVSASFDEETGEELFVNVTLHLFKPEEEFDNYEFGNVMDACENWLNDEYVEGTEIGGRYEHTSNYNFNWPKH